MLMRLFVLSVFFFVKATNFMLYYREELWGYSLEELQRRREEENAKTAAAAAAAEATEPSSTEGA